MTIKLWDLNFFLIQDHTFRIILKLSLRSDWSLQVRVAVFCSEVEIGAD